MRVQDEVNIRDSPSFLDHRLCKVSVADRPQRNALFATGQDTGCELQGVCCESVAGGLRQGTRLIYVGMSGHNMKPGDTEAPDEPKKAKGLFTRRQSHANGRRSGDQFCVYVYGRLIVPALTRTQQEQIGQGNLILHDMTKRSVEREPEEAAVVVEVALGAPLPQDLDEFIENPVG